MAYSPLASNADVAAALGRDLTSDEEARVGAILKKASDLFREEARQTFNPDESTVRLKVTGGQVYLPQHPVVELTAVVDDDGEDVEFERNGQWLYVSMGSDEFVTVTYSHGGTIPPLAKLTVADIARKVLSISPAALEGVSQFNDGAGPYNQGGTYAAWAVGGQTMLSPDDKLIARQFRPRSPRLWVMSS